MRVPFARLFGSAAMSLLIAFGSAGAASADNAPKARSPVMHWPPVPNELPLPGALFPMSMQIAGDDLTDKRVRLFVVIDGQLLDLPMMSVETDAQDSINYTTTMHAPISEIAYRWVAYTLDGNAIVSDRYVVKRACIPRLTFPEVHLDPKLSIPERIEALVDQLAGMDMDIRTYDEVLRVLETLKGFIKE